jgi:hypothetical protein
MTRSRTNSSSGHSDAAARKGRWPDRWWLLAALALTIALASPLLLVDVPPVLDYPNHLARIFVLAHPHDPVLSQFYAPHWRIVPNLGMDVLGTALLKVLPVHVGGRLLLALSLFAPLIGVVAYHRAVSGRFSLWPLASGVIATSGIFHFGFMNFLLSLGLALGCAAMWLVLRRRSVWLATAAGALFVTVIFFTHVFGVILFTLLIGADELARLLARRSTGQPIARETLLVGMHVALASSPAVLLFALCPLSEGRMSIGPWGGIHKLWALFTPVMTTNIGLTLITGVAVFSTFVLLRRRARWAPGAWFTLAVLSLLFVVAPSSIKDGTFIDMRLALMIALVAFASMDPRPTRQGAIAVALLFAVLIGVKSNYIASTWIAHRGDLADVRAAISAVAPGGKVLVARGQTGKSMETPKPARILPRAYRLDGQLGALLAIERKAFWPLMFADPAQQPLDILPPYRAISNPLDEPIDLPYLQGDDALAAGYITNWRKNFDHVLLIDAPNPPPKILGLAAVTVTPYAILYRVLPPR